MGIIGGVGPEATVDYYQSIIALYRQKRGDGSYPEFLVNSINLQRGVELITAGDWPGVVKYLLEQTEKLARAGADFGLIAANTPHIVFDEIRPQSSIPLISIVEATCVTAKEQGLRRVGLFGTRFTMQAKFYPDVFARHGMTIVVPASADQEYVHDKYMNELVNGIFLSETRANLFAIIDRMKVDEQIDGLILGGTELPLILREDVHNGTP
ncbi:MAG: aspartate racemase, partial [Spartobacteria bacterium]|nr:aspartate racemase [Spartobacteria bacterium]